MAWATFLTPDGALRWGFRSGDRYVALDEALGFASLHAFIAAGEAAWRAAEATLQAAEAGRLKLPAYAPDEVTLDVPLRTPYPIVCVGKNYADHAQEMGGGELPSAPVFFTKAPTALLPPEAAIDPHVGVTEALDYEGELAVVIGKSGRDIPPERALEHVFGYTILNDVTARDLQKKHVQYFKGKSLDTFAPLGPEIVPRAAIPDPRALVVRTTVNGELRQNGSVRDLLWPIEALIAELSRGMTLPAGLILATGTPSGVGAGFSPPRFLKPGDEVVVEIDGIGRLKNRVAARPVA
ncbi:fumarylacetoacetate hydrolase family protein [Hydrogenibacillus sp. N12]|uniref:fumarylacetoacetate hydrolase family protein n=1 Tax=Hydrogenibacillus sp. N12 TaxID=2866627 RepID=UPI001C7DDD6D|nr:fumarylacetoacetate hydrolase family protein [Hydrogenibacillus sp. N12]QZA32705.1 fumarylacetoacetate hydrolase family protein [Hydrogenibacillus sp. N12]